MCAIQLNTLRLSVCMIVDSIFSYLYYSFWFLSPVIFCCQHEVCFLTPMSFCGGVSLWLLRFWFCYRHEGFWTPRICFCGGDFGSMSLFFCQHEGSWLIDRLFIRRRFFDKTRRDISIHEVIYITIPFITSTLYCMTTCTVIRNMFFQSCNHGSVLSKPPVFCFLWRCYWILLVLCVCVVCSCEFFLSTWGFLSLSVCFLWRFSWLLWWVFLWWCFCPLTNTHTHTHT